METPCIITFDSSRITGGMLTSRQLFLSKNSWSKNFAPRNRISRARAARNRLGYSYVNTYSIREQRGTDSDGIKYITSKVEFNCEVSNIS